MDKFVDYLNKEIEKNFKSIQNYIEIINNPWCKMTNGGLEKIQQQLQRYQNKIDWCRVKLDTIQNLPQCDCCKMRKFITSFGTPVENFEVGSVYKCKKCNGFLFK